MIITTYLNESGTHGASPISIMAGYVGTAAQWERFNADWTALVRKGWRPILPVRALPPPHSKPR